MSARCLVEADDRPSTTTVLGVPVSAASLEALLDVAFARIAGRRKTLFTTANAHCMVLAQSLPSYAAHFREADAVLPDGISVAWSVRVGSGLPVRRVPGPEFFERFLERAAATGVSVFLFGSSDGTLDRLRQRCLARWPGLKINGTLSPPFGDWSSDTDRRLVDAVNRSGADALFVAMTAPKQELWLSRNLSELTVPFAMGVGAAFDFIAGTKPRAPRLVGQLGFEWLFRLAYEPKRLWRRNVDSAIYLWMLGRDALLRAGRDRRSS